MKKEDFTVDNKVLYKFNTRNMLKTNDGFVGGVCYEKESRFIDDGIRGVIKWLYIRIAG